MNNTNETKSLVLFQAGPVQTFIAAARSTRDLWSGSYMLSWLMAAAAKALVETAGTPVDDTVVFPRLSELGVYKLLQGSKDGTAPETLLNPAMPNRFLAIVPAEKALACAQAAENAFREEFKNIADSVWKYLVAEKEAKPEWKVRWDKQVELFPEITWQTCPIGGDNYEAAYKRCQRLLAARRNTRDFLQFVTDENQEGAVKDALTGKEEVIGDENFQTKVCPEEGPYGAISLIKRFWHEEYLGEKYFTGQKKKFYEGVTYESVPEIAKGNTDSNNLKGSAVNNDLRSDITPKNTDSRNPYVAVIAMDGDQMGKWMDGERRLAGTDSDLALHHKAFSGKLAIFSNECAGEIVRNHGGQLVYAGGDDVVAMLPATKVFDCVCELRKAFQEKVGADQNSVSADVSCGIAIAYEKYPLQRMVQEAQKAEKRAKNDYERGAFAFSLLKHGGEIIHWGAKWDSVAKTLFEKYCEYQKEEDGPVSGRFPYALAGFLAPYELEKQIETSLNVRALLEAELETVLTRQVSEKDNTQTEHSENDNTQTEDPEKSVRAKLRDLCHAYIKELSSSKKWDDFVKLFLTAAFIYRKR